MRQVLAFLSVFLFLLTISIPNVHAEAVSVTDSLSQAFESVGDLNVGELYEKYPHFIDAILIFMFFYFLLSGQAWFTEKFGKMLPIVIAIMLTIGYLALIQQFPEYSFKNLGYIAIIIGLFVMGWSIYKTVGEHLGGGAMAFGVSVAIPAMFLSAMSPQLFGTLMQKIPALSLVIVFAVFAVIFGLIKMLPSHTGNGGIGGSGGLGSTGSSGGGFFSGLFGGKSKVPELPPSSADAASTAAAVKESQREEIAKVKEIKEDQVLEAELKEVAADQNQDDAAHATEQRQADAVAQTEQKADAADMRIAAVAKRLSGLLTQLAADPSKTRLLVPQIRMMEQDLDATFAYAVQTGNVATQQLEQFRKDHQQVLATFKQEDQKFKDIRTHLTLLMNNTRNDLTAALQLIKTSKSDVEKNALFKNRTQYQTLLGDGQRLNDDVQKILVNFDQYHAQSVPLMDTFSKLLQSCIGSNKMLIDKLALVKSHSYKATEIPEIITAAVNTHQNMQSMLNEKKNVDAMFNRGVHLSATIKRSLPEFFQRLEVMKARRQAVAK